MSQCAAPLWERPVLRQTTGGTLRPGGLELTDRLANLVGVKPGWRVLDVGSGLGATVSRLRSRFGAQAYGVEPSDKQVQDTLNVTGLVRGEGESLPFQDGTFKAVFCECVLSLFHSPLIGLVNFSRVLEPGGYLALSDLYSMTGKQTSGKSCADRALTLESLEEMLISCGFKVRYMEDHTRELANLAAHLLWNGEQGGFGCSGNGLGYYLLIAQKEGARHAG